MAQKLYERQHFENSPSTKTPLDEINMNKLDKGLSDVDDRVLELYGYQGIVEEAKNETLKARDDSAEFSRRASGSANLAESAMQTAKISEEAAKRYADNAFSATPEGYDEVVSKVEKNYNTLYPAEYYNSKLQYSLSGDKTKAFLYLTSTESIMVENRKVRLKATLVLSTLKEIVFSYGYGATGLSPSLVSYKRITPTTTTLEIDELFDMMDYYTILGFSVSYANAESGDTITMKNYSGTIFTRGDTNKTIVDRISDAEKDITGIEDSQNVHFTSDTEITVDTKKGGMRFVGAKGGQHKSENLFDKSDSKKSWSKYMINGNDDNNGLYPTESWDVYRIPIKGNTVYTLYVNQTGLNCGYRFLDSSKTVIDKKAGKGYNNKNVITFTSPSDAIYVEISIKNTTDGTDTLSEGTEALQYEPYGLSVAGDMGFWNGEWEQKAISSTGSVENSNNNWCITKVNLEGGDALSVHHYGNSATMTYYLLGWFRKDGSFIRRDLATYSSDISITAPSDAYYVYIGFGNTGITVNPQNIGKITVTINGQYAVCVKEHSDNIFDYSDYKAWYLPSGSIYRKALKLKPNTAYIVQTTEDRSGTSPWAYCISGNNLDFTASKDGNGIMVDKPMAVTSDANGFITIAVYNGIADNVLTVYESKTVFVPTSQPLPEGDYINENGEYHGKGIYDLSKATWTWYADYEAWQTESITDFIKPISTDVFKGISEKYVSITSSLGSQKSQGIFASQSKNRIWVNNGSTTEKPSGLLVYELATPSLTPLTSEQKIALASLESYEGQTHISTADNLATLSIAYGKSDTVATALNGERLAQLEKAEREAFEKVTASQLVTGLNIIKSGHMVSITCNTGISYNTLKSITVPYKPVKTTHGIAWIMNGSTRYVGRATLYDNGTFIVGYPATYGGSYTECTSGMSVEITINYITED